MFLKCFIDYFSHTFSFLMALFKYLIHSLNAASQGYF